MIHYRVSEPGGSSAARGVTARLWSEKFGVEVWLVPEPTGKERVELTPVAARQFIQVTEVLGGELLELEGPGGGVHRPVPGWEERVRTRKLLDLEVRYDLLLDRERELRARLDDRSATEAERVRVRKEWEAEVAELNRLIETIRECGHEMTGDEIRDGFEASLRRTLAGGSPPAEASSPSGEDGAPSSSDGTLTVESARDILRKERPLGAIDGL